MTTICGIDEAGRGPVIGPLVIAGALIDEAQIPILQRIGVKDSKRLTPEQRQQMYYQLVSTLKAYEILVIQPFVIDEAVFTQHNEMNLNWLEALKTVEIINKLQPEKVIVDCPSNNIAAYSHYLRQRLTNKHVHLVCEHKADATYHICAAASILAKVTRDKEVEKIRHDIGVEFGSGYPSDPRTVAFLRDYWDKFDHIFRKSWASWQKYDKNKEQRSLGEW